MTERTDDRSPLDRVLRRVRPGVDPSFHPEPRALADGLWVIDRRLRFPPALSMPYRMTVLRLPSGGLLLHSPVQLDAATAAALDGLGRVEAVLAPNSFHYVFIADYCATFPQATVLLAPDLPDRVPTLPPGARLSDAAPPGWAGTIDHVVFGPVRRFTEVVLFHRPSATLVMTDLAFNMRVSADVWNRVGWRLFGVPSRFGPSRSARVTLLRDRAAAAPYLRRMLDWEFRRIIVAHGDPLEADAQAEFRRAFRKFLA